MTVFDHIETHLVKQARLKAYEAAGDLLATTGSSLVRDGVYHGPTPTVREILERAREFVPKDEQEDVEDEDLTVGFLVAAARQLLADRLQPHFYDKELNAFLARAEKQLQEDKHS